MFVQPRLPNEDELLVNATLVAGTDLRASEKPCPARPARSKRRVAPFIGDLRALPPRRRGVADAWTPTSAGLAFGSR